MSYLSRYEKRVSKQAAKLSGPSQIVFSVRDRSPRRMAKMIPVAVRCFDQLGYRLVSQDQQYENRPLTVAAYRSSLIFERRESASR